MYFSVHRVAKITVLAAVLLSAPVVGAASFDCARAATAVEQMVCSDSELSALDDELGKLFDKNRREVDIELRAQRAWLKERNCCGDHGCVRHGRPIASVFENCVTSR